MKNFKVVVHSHAPAGLEGGVLCSKWLLHRSKKLLQRGKKEKKLLQRRKKERKNSYKSGKKKEKTLTQWNSLWRWGLIQKITHTIKLWATYQCTSSNCLHFYNSTSTNIPPACPEGFDEFFKQRKRSESLIFILEHVPSKKINISIKRCLKY